MGILMSIVITLHKRPTKVLSTSMTGPIIQATNLSEKTNSSSENGTLNLIEEP